MKSPSLIFHDTFVVLRANEEAFKLFRATSEQLIGTRIVDLLVDDDDMRRLAEIRMKLARSERHFPPQVEYIFKRFDGTCFMAHVETDRISPDEWESQIIFISEY